MAAWGDPLPDDAQPIRMEAGWLSKRIRRDVFWPLAVIVLVGVVVALVGVMTAR